MVLKVFYDYVTFHWIWTGNLLDSDLQLHLIDTLLALDLKILGIQISITILNLTGFGV